MLFGQPSNGEDNGNGTSNTLKRYNSLSLLLQKTMRNIINPGQLSSALHARAEKRAPSVQAWLSKQFCRWCLSHFNELQPVTQVDEYQRLVGETAPVWFIHKLEQGQTFDYLDPNHPKLRELETKLAEFLSGLVGSNEERKFPRYTVEQILAKWEADHQRMQQKRSEGWCETDGSGRRQVFALEQLHVIEFISSGRSLRAELSNESYWMRHCVGQFSDKTTLSGGYGESYAQAIEDRRMRIFSLRDKQDQPHATLSFDIREHKASGEPYLAVEQIKGKQNQPPITKYVDTIVAFLNDLEVQDVHHRDCHIMGVFRHQKLISPIAEIDDPATRFHAVSLNPELIFTLPNITPALRWAALRTHPNIVEKLPDCSPVQLYSAGQWLNGELPTALASSEPHWLREALAGDQTLQIDGKVLAIDPQPEQQKSLWRRFLNRSSELFDQLPNIIGIPVALLLFAIILALAIPFMALALIYAMGWAFKRVLIDKMENRSEWAMAIAGIFIFRFEDNYRRFDTDASDEEKANRAAMFARDWGIGGEGVSQEQARTSLLTQVHSMWRNGHFSSYIHRPSSEASAKDVLAFDFTRLGLLVRTGVLLNYISEAEGWNYMYCGAAQVQDLFSSWDDYGESYVRGRAWWAGENCVDVQEEHKKFRADSNSTWNSLKWCEYEVFVTDEDHRKILSNKEGKH